jgi:hypothetical protein
VVAARGDGGIRTQAYDTAITSVGGARYFNGLAGWYQDGYHYLMTSTLLSRNRPDCAGNPTSPAIQSPVDPH